MKDSFEEWLVSRQMSESSATSRVSNAKRVENFYGDLDDHFDRDSFHYILSQLRYSSQDERSNRENPSEIPINGNLRNGLATLRSSIELYAEFRQFTKDGMTNINNLDTPDTEEIVKKVYDSFSLERDLQSTLRRSIHQLEPGLQIIDDGAERSVSSGFIDITARDERGSVVVIELKSGTAGQKAVGQILSYMGDITDEEPDREVRGILVAADFDKKACAAARVIPVLSLRAYRVNFDFVSAD